MKRLVKIILLCVVFPSGVFAAQIQPTFLAKKQMPGSIKVTEKFLAASRWIDKKGDNLVVLSKAESDVGDDGVEAELYVVAFQKNGHDWIEKWRLFDFVEPCNVDLVCDFVKNSLEVTDLDENGVAEVSFVYRLACVGDMSAWSQKLFVVEDGKKYPLRGSVDHQIDEKGRVRNASQMKVDTAFNAAPASFRKYAVNKWKRFAGRELETY